MPDTFGHTWMTESMHSERATEPMVGNRWVLGEQLGEGAFGRVLAGSDKHTGEQVAVKLLRELPIGHRPRLQRELRALRLLDHPGVVRLLADGPTEQGHYIVMERLPSVSFPGPGPRDWERLRPVAVGLFQALAHVHDQGIVHRDLKPGNVLMRDQQPVLLDFGLARGDDIGSTITRTGARMGTLRYISPEQGSGERVTLHTDLYSAGLMLYEALSGGKLPHKASGSAELLRLRIARPPRPIRDLVPGLDPTAAAIVDALVARDPQDRPAHAHAVLQLLSEGTAHALPWLGNTAFLDDIVDRLTQGETVKVGGVPGSGRSRLLQEVAARMPHRWLVPGRRPFESLGSLVSDLDMSDVRSGGEARARVQKRLPTDAVLLVDGVALDWSTRRLLNGFTGPVLWVDDDSEGVVVPPLSSEDLRTVFGGPDRVLHLREDAAQELFRRTDGQPRSVVAELAAWRRAGIARPTEGLLRVERVTLDRLRAEHPPKRRAPRSDIGDPLPRHLDSLLCAVDVAGEHATTDCLSELAELPVWELEEALEELEVRGHIRREGALPVVLDAVAEVRWTEEERVQAHASMARMLSAGTRGRLRHMVEGGVTDGIVEEAVQAARTLERAGMLAEGRGWLEKAALVADDSAALRPVLENHLRMALDAADGTAGTEAVGLLRARPRGAGELLAVADAIEALGQGQADAVLTIVDALDPFSDRRLEALVQRHVRLPAIRLLRGDDTPEVRALASEDWPKPWGRIWAGLLAYRDKDLVRAATEQEAAAQEELRAAHRVRLRLRAATTWSSVGRYGRTVELATAGKAEAARRRLPVLELRAEWTLRSVQRRQGGATVDEELVEAATELAPTRLEGIYALFNEGYVAWKKGDLQRANGIFANAANNARGMGHAGCESFACGFIAASMGDHQRVLNYVNMKWPVGSLDLLELLARQRPLTAEEGEVRDRLRDMVHAIGAGNAGMFQH